jgi:hypothetical protein
MRARTLSVLLMLATVQAARAQNRPAGDSVLKGTTIDVIQAYKPKIKPSPKPEWIPQLPPADTSHPAFSYEVPQQTLYYTYNSLPLQPLALEKMFTKAPFPNYIKAGGGNLSTIFLDAGIGGIYGKNYETAIHVHHISQNSNNIKFQQTSLSGIEADGVKHGAKTDLHATVSAQRNQYNYYGYDHFLYDYPQDSVRQTYTSARIAVDLKNRQDSTGGRFDYNPGAFASVYRSKLNATELSAGINAPITYRLDSTLDLKMSVNGVLTHFSNDFQRLNNSYIAVAPGLAWHGPHLRGHALLGLALGLGNQGYILPDVLGAYHATNNNFIISAGWKAQLRQNTYEQLSTENPYMLNDYQVLQMRNDEVFARFQGRAGDHFSFTGNVSWWNFTNMPVFLNVFTAAGRKFAVHYQDLNAISFGAGLRYQVADRWSAGTTVDVYSFFNITDQYGFAESKVWQVPNLRIKGDFMFNLTPKLSFTAYVALLGGIYAKDVSDNVVNLSAIADVGGNAEYQIVPRLSVFVQLNNLLNNKYQRWQYYEAYGLNIYGGLRLKF